MKKHIASILLLLFVQQIQATTFYDQLCNFNINWKKYKTRAPEGTARNFNSDKEYIQAHLSSVLPILQSNPVAHLSAEQLHSRMKLVDILDGYRTKGNFPINYYRHERIPIFIDQRNTHCAVGYLMQQTGYEDLALRIAAADNYAWVKDIHEAGLLEWQKASGLSLAELELIQGAYDYYMPDAFLLPNKYEIPQKPACMVTYFDSMITGQQRAKKTENIWCRGEGVNGVLNGIWEQNYAVGIPWIIGYYENGKRSGQWKEYYQGTKQLCRTENWRDDKLNGIRKRFDRSGTLIEEILFKNGNAVTKTNYDLTDSLVWIRKPLDSNTVWTEIFTFGGALIASGHEKVYNPANLLWFQNIELTTLNSIGVSARSIVSETNSSNDLNSSSPITRRNLYNTPPLVEYKKEGDWMYYKESAVGGIPANSVSNMLIQNYRHFGYALFQSIQMFDDLKTTTGYDSIRVVYTDNLLHEFYGYGNSDYAHLQIRYHDSDNRILLFKHRTLTVLPRIKELGQYDRENQKIGVWKHYDRTSALYKTENFIIPRKEEETIELTQVMH